MLRVIFQPALPMRGVTSPSSDDRATVSFQPALPMRGVTLDELVSFAARLFQPALPMRGVTREGQGDTQQHQRFQPALPMRGVTMTKLTRGFTFLFQPALPMRGVTAGDDGRCVTGHISTRTPHAGSDACSWSLADEARISTRTPHAGSDAVIDRVNNPRKFQPALPMRGVTAILCANLLLRSTYSVIRQTRYTQQARQASLCHTIWCEPHVCHMRASCSHHGPTTPRTLQLRTLVSHLHAQSSSHICFQDCRIANYLSPDRSARRARS